MKKFLSYVISVLSVTFIASISVATAAVSTSSPSQGVTKTPTPSGSPSGTYWDSDTEQTTTGNCTSPSASASNTASPSKTPTAAPSSTMSAAIPIIWPEGCSAETEKYAADGPGHKKGDPVLGADGKPVWQCVTPPKAWNGTVNGATCSSGSCNKADMTKCYKNGIPKCSCAP